MPRGLSTAAKQYTGPVAWLADITPRPKTPAGSETVRRYADQAVTVAGISYEPLLRITGGARFTRTLAADFGEIDLVFNPNLANQDPATNPPIPFEDFEGALCELSQLLLGLDERILLLRGRLTEREETDAGMRFRLVSELDPAQLQAHDRLYSPLCTWRFRRGLCGYLDSGFSFTEQLAERTATAGAIHSITDSTLAMTVDEHKDRYVLLTAGLGRGQVRRIRSNTATALTVWTPFDPIPDTTTKFKVFSITAGISKPLWTAAGSAVLSLTVGETGQLGGRSIQDTSLAMVADEHKGEILVWHDAAETFRQVVRIKSNTGTIVTIEDDEPNLIFIPDDQGPQGRMHIRHRRCPKDFVACETRARTEAHNGFPTLVPLVSRALGGPDDFNPGDLGDGDGFGGGGGGGGGGGIPL